ncbi:MAG: malonyl-ACP O-methyltransferase BioC [Candidatus Omnitrophica bacterium]|nr:malonyl-ACP O-methyltransferase BioC [Candidatus Omnitrophota bacterium]
MNKQAIVKAFSRCARLYDDYADIQKQAAEELAGWIHTDGFRRILEIGCGTGNYTLRLKNKFEYSGLLAVDISQEMIEVARNKLQGREVEFVTADAENFSFPGEFNLITSNACFQWFVDLEKAFLEYEKMLTPGGWIIFSIFGPRTFFELNDALAACLKDKSIPAAAFLPRDKIAGILNRNFNGIEIREEIYRETFPCLRDLLRKIKYTGIRGEAVNSKAILGPKSLKKIEEAYLDMHKQIRATYQVFFCKGVKK